MRRFATTMVVAVAVLLGGSAVVEAVYPPPDVITTPDNLTPGPGEPFTVTVTGCLVGELVEFSFEGQFQTDFCEADPDADGVAFTGRAAPSTPDADGVAFASLAALSAPEAATFASATLVAPSVPGTYIGEATLLTSNVIVPFTITVEAAATATTVSGELPSTGSSSLGTWVPMAVLLLLFGAGLYGVAQVRRRRLTS